MTPMRHEPTASRSRIKHSTTVRSHNFAKGEDPDEMPHNVAFHLDLHFLLRSKRSEIHHNLEILTCDPLKIDNVQSHSYFIYLYGKIHRPPSRLLANYRFFNTPTKRSNAQHLVEYEKQLLQAGNKNRGMSCNSICIPTFVV